MKFAARRQRLLKTLAAQGWDALLVYGNAWRGDYLRYCTNFACLDGHAVALVHREGDVQLLVQGAGEAERARVECDEVRVECAASLFAVVEERLAQAADGLVAAAPWPYLPARLTRPQASPPLLDATPTLDALMRRKDADELAAIRRAAELADQAYAVFRNAARPGRAEYELSAEVEAALRAYGCPDNFMLLASGGREVRGMHPPGERRLQPGDLVTTELTPRADGYYVQICRTLVIGEPSETQRRAFQVFEEAAAAGLAAVRPGITGGDVARAENDVFRRRGLGDYLTHEYTRVRGHSFGLYVDGTPQIVEDDRTLLEAGMTLIVHPNTYHPEAGYLVLGDPALVTDDGCDILTRTPRRLFSVSL